MSLKKITKLCTKKLLLNQNRRNFHVDLNVMSGLMAGSVGLMGCAGLFMGTRYRIAAPNQYIVKTGIMIDGVDINKNTFQWPFQVAKIMDMSPSSHHMIIDKAMSKEKIAFKMPIAFTIGPKDDIESLTKYATKLIGMEQAKLYELIYVAVAGSCRMQAGNLELEQIFSDRIKFRDEVINIINNELEQFGIKILTMNIEELEDMEGNEYFVFLRKKALEGAVNTAKIDVAEQLKKGDIGQKTHQSETRIKVADLEKEAKLVENIRDRDISESDATLNIARTEYNKTMILAKLEADANSKKRDLELQKEIEEYRKNQETEKLRASEMSLTNVKAEILLKNTDAQAKAKIEQTKGEADALLRITEANALALVKNTKAQTEAKIEIARGEAEAIRLIADANFLAKQNEAKGIQLIKESEAKGIEAIGLAEAKSLEAMKAAEADGFRKMVDSAGGTPELVNYMFVHNDIPTKVAQAHATGLNGMNPKINYWHTGPNDGSNGFANTLKDLVKGSLPFTEGLKDQTGIDVTKFFNNFVNQKSPTVLAPEHPTK